MACGNGSLAVHYSAQRRVALKSVVFDNCWTKIWCCVYTVHPNKLSNAYDKVSQKLNNGETNAKKLIDISKAGQGFTFQYDKYMVDS